MRALAALLLLFAGTPLSLAHAGDWEFRVLLDGREIGRHRYTLAGAGEDVVLRSEAEFDVRLLFFSAFHYEHEAVELWQGGCLQSLVSRTETNGERMSVTARSEGGRLAVQGPSGSREHEGCVLSFAYWDPRILAAEQLLNSQTGELIPVQVTPQGTEAVTVQGRALTASRHRISGRGLQIELWYANGRWVALETAVDGGRRLRYELL